MWTSILQFSKNSASLLTNPFGTSDGKPRSFQETDRLQAPRGHSESLSITFLVSLYLWLNKMLGTEPWRMEDIPDWNEARVTGKKPKTATGWGSHFWPPCRHGALMDLRRRKGKTTLKQRWRICEKADPSEMACPGLLRAQHSSDPRGVEGRGDMEAGGAERGQDKWNTNVIYNILWHKASQVT